MWEDISQILGLIGVAIVLSAYALKEFRYGFGDSLKYSLMNIIGSLGIAFSLVYDFNLAAMIQEVVWIVIALFGLKNVFERRNKRAE